MHANRVNLPSFDNLKPTVAVVLIVARSRQCRANAGVDIAVIREQSLKRGMVEISAVVYTGLFAWSAAEDLWSPCVAFPISEAFLPKACLCLQVAIEVNDAHRAIFTVDAAQEWESDCMVST